MSEPPSTRTEAGTIATKEPESSRAWDSVAHAGAGGTRARAGDRAEESLLRRVLLWLLILGMTGTGVELILLEHTETVWQLMPIFALAAGLISAVMVQVRPGRPALRVFQAIMLAFLAAGVTGLILHYRGNAEFELEMHPSMNGWQLIWSALRGATPALAPGTMAQLGLLGLAYTFRHPLLRGSRGETGSRGAAEGAEKL